MTKVYERFVLINLGQFLLLFLLVLCISVANAQITKVSGVVTDSVTGEPLPFVNVAFKGTTIGTITDLEGMYHIETSHPTDSLLASFVGYETTYRTVKLRQTQKINFQMPPSNVQLEEVVVLPGENPAHILLRKVIENKERNDKEHLQSYEYEVYNKVQFDFNNLTEKFMERRVFKPFDFVFENVDTSKVNGKVYLPAFITEALSRYYYRKDPKAEKEVVKATNVSGLENETVSQFLGDMYQHINIYDNFIEVFGKSFISPVANFGKAYYKYYLVDSMYIGNKWTYKMQFVPRRKYEPTFYGDVWIHDTTYAVQRVDMRMTETANINFVDDLVVNQEYDIVQDSTWMLTKDKLLVDFTLSDQTLGLYGTKTTTYRDFKLNQPRSDEFYSGPQNIIVEEGAEKKGDEFWQEKRHEKPTEKEENIYHMVDSIKDMPAFRTYYDIVYLIVSGYLEWGKIQLGPYSRILSFNQVERIRVGLGIRTDDSFSDRVRLHARGAYGFRDERFKYGGGINMILSKQHPRQALDLEYQFDIEQLGVGRDAYSEDNLLGSVFRRRPFNKLSLVEDYRANYEVEWFHGFSNWLGFVHREITPADTAFIQYNYTDDQYQNNRIATAELRLGTRFKYREKFVGSGIKRTSLGSDYPEISVEYGLGLDNFLEGQFEYHKLNVWVTDWFKINPIGYTDYILNVGKIWGTLPYPLLQLHQGNETYYMDDYAFNMMNYIEFVSDEYAQLFVTHHFNGFFLNKIPLMRKLKWREVIHAKAAIGRLKDSNRELMVFPQDLYSLDGPYAEAGVGVENILRFLRFDVLWRLTHKDHPNIQTFGFRVSLRFNL